MPKEYTLIARGNLTDTHRQLAIGVLDILGWQLDPQNLEAEDELVDQDLVARGNQSADERKATMLVLGNLGLDVDVQRIEEPAPGELPYALDEIDNLDQYLCREHLLEFWSQQPEGDYAKSHATAAFNALINLLNEDPNGSIDPAVKSAMSVKKREELGFPPYRHPQTQQAPQTEENAQFVVQVGTILKIADKLKEEGSGWILQHFYRSERQQFGKKSQEFLLKIAEHFDRKLRTPQLFYQS